MSLFDLGNGRSNFVAGFSGNPRAQFFRYAEGYGRAARTVADKLIAAPGLRDNDAYPAVFLYRHSLELALKGLIYRAALLAALTFSDEADAPLSRTHDLGKLGTAASALLSALYPDDKWLAALLHEMRQLCSEWTAIDPASYSYRYPTDVKGGHSTKRHQTLNVQVLAETMDSVLERLGGVELGLTVDADKAAEVWEIVTQAIRRLQSTP